MKKMEKNPQFLSEMCFQGVDFSHKFYLPDHLHLTQSQVNTERYDQDLPPVSRRDLSKQRATLQWFKTLHTVIKDWFCHSLLWNNSFFLNY